MVNYLKKKKEHTLRKCFTMFNGTKGGKMMPRSLICEVIKEKKYAKKVLQSQINLKSTCAVGVCELLHLLIIHRGNSRALLTILYFTSTPFGFRMNDSRVM